MNEDEKHAKELNEFAYLSKKDVKVDEKEMEELRRIGGRKQAMPKNVYSGKMGKTGTGKTTVIARYEKGLGADLSYISSTRPNVKLTFVNTILELNEPRYGGPIELDGKKMVLTALDTAGQQTLRTVGGGFQMYNIQKLTPVTLSGFPTFLCAANDKDSVRAVYEDWADPYDKAALSKKGEVVNIIVTKTRTDDTLLNMKEINDGDCSSLDSYFEYEGNNLLEQLEDLFGTKPIIILSDQIIGNNQAEVKYVGMTLDGDYLPSPIELHYKGTMGLAGLIYLADVKKVDINSLDRDSRGTLEELKRLGVR